ncbi:MAG: molybdopterin-dependent oxidoreductase [Eggerthellaceae bacterium]|nr:molybdopterin-dependent oxidoreductase [Eggerthellaceae bacterium]
MGKEAIADKTVVATLGFCNSGMNSNIGAIDVKDGRAVRIRPLHYDERYTEEELNAWQLEARGSVFKPGMKSFLPPLSLAYKNRTYSKNRVPYPLKRVDFDPHGERNPQNRGTSKYVRISWDEALSIAAEEIKRVHDTYGPMSILVQADGHGETKAYHGQHGVMVELFQWTGDALIQTRNADSWEGWYWGAKHMWGMEPVGQNIWQTNVIQDVAKNSDAVLYWGADPETTPWGWGGQQASRICYWFNELGIKSIWIAPDVNYANAVHADKWIPVYPNTDAALQLAIAYVWLTEGLYDKDYIASHAVGFDWFEYYVLGNEDGVPKTPEWAAEKCGVPDYTIKALARYWAKHNVSIAHCNGGSYIRSCFAHEPARLEIALLGMQALGHPGRNFFKFIEWSLWSMKGLSPLPCSEVFPTTEGAYHGRNRADLPPNGTFIPKTLIPQGIATEADNPLKWFGHTLSGAPMQDQLFEYEFPVDDNPGVRMIWSDSPCWTTCWNGGHEMEEAFCMDKVEFILVQHPWMENDTTFADIILPVSTKLECEDIGTDTLNGQWGILCHEEQAVDPYVECISDWEACLGVAEKLQEYGGIYKKLVKKMTQGLDMEQTLERGFKMSRCTDEDLTWDDLKEQQFWMSPTMEGWQDEPAGMIEFYEDPDNHPLSTPTGKLEYYSTTLAKVFPDDTERAPVPKWVDETEDHKERLTSERAKDYPFLLVSNHPRWRVHANCDDIPWLREIPTCKITGPDGYGYEPVWINTEDAAELGIKTGDIVKLFNERGGVLGGAYVTERIYRHTVYQDHGARVDPIVKGRQGLDRGGANNTIAPQATTSKNCAGEVTSGYLVGVEKVDVFELAEQYPEAFSKPYDEAFGLTADRYIIEEA